MLNTIQALFFIKRISRQRPAKNLTVFGRHMRLALFLSLGFSLYMSNSDANTTLQSQAVSPTFGRLFTTSLERSQLNHLRQTKANTLAEVKQEVTEENVSKPVMLPASIMMQGYVKRNDGAKSTVWINQQALLEGAVYNEVHIGKLQKSHLSFGQQLNMHISANGQKLVLKAGQIYDLEKNMILELSHATKGHKMQPKSDNMPLSSPKNTD